MKINPVNVSFGGYIRVKEAVNLNKDTEVKNLTLDTSKIKKIVNCDDMDDVVVTYQEAKGINKKYSLACDYNNFVTSYIAAEGRDIVLECGSI